MRIASIGPAGKGRGPGVWRTVHNTLSDFADTDSLYIDLAGHPSVDSRQVTPGVVLDFDAAGALVGIDIDRASVQLDLSGLGSGACRWS